VEIFSFCCSQFDLVTSERLGAFDFIPFALLSCVWDSSTFCVSDENGSSCKSVTAAILSVKNSDSVYNVVSAEWSSPPLTDTVSGVGELRSI